MWGVLSVSDCKVEYAKSIGISIVGCSECIGVHYIYSTLFLYEHCDLFFSFYNPNLFIKLRLPNSTLLNKQAYLFRQYTYIGFYVIVMESREMTKASCVTKTDKGIFLSLKHARRMHA